MIRLYNPWVHYDWLWSSLTDTDKSPFYAEYFSTYFFFFFYDFGTVNNSSGPEPGFYRLDDSSGWPPIYKNSCYTDYGLSFASPSIIRLG
jgi:hypothetical protein